jgi:hypothetical protein
MGVFVHRHLSNALEAWAEEVASAKDPDLRDQPLRWMFSASAIRGYTPHDCPAEQKSIRLTRWAGVLNLALKPVESPRDVGVLTFVGEIEGFPVRLSDTVDEAARNRALLESGSAR